MKIAARKPLQGGKSKREQLLLERMGKAPLRELFPDVAKVHIELVFSSLNVSSLTPSSQHHTMYAGATAFFRFPCPCADCDGDFDLTGEVSALVQSSAGRKRSSTRSGRLSCQGMQFRQHATLQSSCPMQVSFSIESEPQRAADSRVGGTATG